MTKIDTSTETIEAPMPCICERSQWLQRGSRECDCERALRAKVERLEADNERLKAQADSVWNEAIDMACATIVKEARETLNGVDEYAAGMCADTIRSLKRPVKGENHE